MDDLHAMPLVVLLFNSASQYFMPRYYLLQGISYTLFIRIHLQFQQHRYMIGIGASFILLDKPQTLLGKGENSLIGCCLGDDYLSLTYAVMQQLGYGFILKYICNFYIAV